MATPAIPRPAPAQPTPPQPRRAPAASPPPQAHGGNVQYQQRMTGVHVDRNENLINHNWYKFLLWILVLGGLALLGWLIYGGYQWGWHANPCKPPCVVTPVLTPAPATRQAPAPRATARPAPIPPMAASLDLSPVERGLNRIADNLSQPAATEPARVNPRPTPEELDEATARWLEGQRDP